VLKSGAAAVDTRRMDRTAEGEREDGAAGENGPDLDAGDGVGRDRRERERRVVDRRDADGYFPGPLPLDRERRVSSTFAAGARALVKWTAAVAVLLLVGGVAVWQGWTLLLASSADGSRMPTSSCVDRAVANAEEFAAVLGDERDVDRTALEASCAHARS
jgi:hypothetical protein